MINNVLPIILGILGLLSAYFVYLKDDKGEQHD